MYCVIDPSQLEDELGFDKMYIDNTESSTGDKCHRDIKGVEDKDLVRFMKKYFQAPKLFLCCKGELLNLTKEQLGNLESIAKECI